MAVTGRADTAQAAVAISELYDNVIADRLRTVLPVAWSYRDRGRNRTAAFELDGIDDPMLAEFSKRSIGVHTRTAELTAKFRDHHGRSPSRVERTKLAQQATQETRPDKTPHALGDLLTDWRQRARLLTGREPLDLAAAALTGSYGRPLHTADVGVESLQQLAKQIVHGAQQRRSTWDVWNLHAEASRATRTLRIRSTEQRVQLTDRVVAAAAAMCVPIDGSAAKQPVTAGATYEARYTSQAILDAEQALLEQNRATNAPAVPDGTADAAATATVHDRGEQVLMLSPDQRWAVVDIATSGRSVDVLVGPAGTGKTLTLAVLRPAWERRFGHGSVIGLAPSAAAAGELSKALGLRCETTAKWLWETTGRSAEARAAAISEQQQRFFAARPNGDRAAQHRAATALAHLNEEERRWRLLPGQLVIVDEAAMSGTIDLAQLVNHARRAGAKLLLVGDHRQLSPVPAGGVFGLLVRRGHSAATLEGLWRFQHRWEAHATRQLRNGDPSCLEIYAKHGRINGGDHDAMLDAAHAAWAADRAAGRTSLLVAADNATVTELNQRVRTVLVAAGEVAAEGVELRDGTTAGIGDIIVTRENARRIRTTDGRWVRNGDTWQVVDVHPDGALTVQETTPTATGASVVTFS